MRRFFVLMILGILVFWAMRATRPRPVRPAPPPARWHEPRRLHGPAGRDFAAEARQQTQEALVEARQAIDEARHEVRQAWREARDEVRQAWNEVSDEVRQAYHEGVVADGGAPPVPAPPPPPPPPAVALPREEADGLPVPIVPGTRVTEAEVRPPTPPVSPHPVVVVRHGRAPKAPKAVAPPPRPPAPTETRTINGLISATIERYNEARKALRGTVTEWLEPEVPRTWTPPARLLEAMVLDTQYDTIVKDYGTLYVAKLKVDVSPRRRTVLVETYDREVVRRRLATLGGTLAFVLICLAVISGYIRADEATKGYYTNRLRMLAAAGVGAGGVIIYNVLA